MPTQITTEDDDGRATTVRVQEGVPVVTHTVNLGRKEGNSFAAFTGDDGKGVTINPLEVTDIREV